MINLSNDLIQNIDKLHTTELGILRIKKNLEQKMIDVVDWCKYQIILNKDKITRKGKNWYITTSNSVITVNAYSYTIITVHKHND